MINSDLVIITAFGHADLEPFKRKVLVADTYLLTDESCERLGYPKDENGQYYIEEEYLPGVVFSAIEFFFLKPFLQLSEHGSVCGDRLATIRRLIMKLLNKPELLKSFEVDEYANFKTGQFSPAVTYDSLVAKLNEFTATLDYAQKTQSKIHW